MAHLGGQRLADPAVEVHGQSLSGELAEGAFLAHAAQYTPQILHAHDRPDQIEKTIHTIIFTGKHAGMKLTETRPFLNTDTPFPRLVSSPDIQTPLTRSAVDKLKAKPELIRNMHAVKYIWGEGVPWGHFTLPCQPLKQTDTTPVSECVLVFVCNKKRRLPKLVQGVQVQAATCQRFMVELAGGFTIA